jgi:ankyrin repeat protein
MEQMSTPSWPTRFSLLGRHNRRGPKGLAPPEAPPPLHAAVAARNPLQVKSLLSYGADANLRDQRGWTPLHCAARLESGCDGFDLAQVLLDHGARVNPLTADGYPRTALHIALASRLADNVTVLARPAPVASYPSDAQPTGGEPPPTGTYLLAALLLERGAEVNARDYRGWTPLHHAATVYAPDCGPPLVRLLLSHGADPRIRTLDSGKTAVEHAFATGRNELAQLLDGAGELASGRADREPPTADPTLASGRNEA